MKLIYEIVEDQEDCGVAHNVALLSCEALTDADFAEYKKFKEALEDRHNKLAEERKRLFPPIDMTYKSSSTAGRIAETVDAEFLARREETYAQQEARTKAMRLWDKEHDFDYYKNDCKKSFADWLRKYKSAEDVSTIVLSDEGER